MLKRILILLSTLMLMGCAAAVNAPKEAFIPQVNPDKPEINCEQPQGREYVCYSEAECGEYFKSYGSMVAHRIHMQKEHGWYDGVETHIVHINVFDDKNRWYWIGRIEAKQHGEDRIYMKFWLNTYDEDCVMLHSGYRDGTIRQLESCKREKSYEQNYFKLKDAGR